MTRISRIAALAACAMGALIGCGKDPERTTEARPQTESTNESTNTPPNPQSTPPLRLSDAARSGVSADGTYAVRWEIVGGTIPDAEPFAIAFAVTRTDGKPVAPDARVFVDAEMPHHGHGMNFVPTVKRQGGDTFLGEGLLFHMPGRWVLAIDVGEDGIRERTQWYVDVE